MKTYKIYYDKSITDESKFIDDVENFDNIKGNIFSNTLLPDLYVKNNTSQFKSRNRSKIIRVNLTEPKYLFYDDQIFTNISFFKISLLSLIYTYIIVTLKILRKITVLNEFSNKRIENVASSKQKLNLIKKCKNNMLEFKIYIQL